MQVFRGVVRLILLRNLIVERTDELICSIVGQINAFLVKALKSLAKNGISGGIHLNSIFKGVKIIF